MSRYRQVYAPRHSRANSQGRVLEHVLVWEATNGPVPVGLELHHINGDTHDNRLENLEPLTRREHMAKDGRLERFATLQPLATAARKRNGWVQPHKTHCKHGHELTPENRGASQGRCLKCHARRQRERKRRLTELASQQRERARVDGAPARSGDA